MRRARNRIQVIDTATIKSSDSNEKLLSNQIETKEEMASASPPPLAKINKNNKRAISDREDDYYGSIKINESADIDTEEEEEFEEDDDLSIGSDGDNDSYFSEEEDEEEELLSEVDSGTVELTPSEKYLAPIDSEDDDFATPPTTIGKVPLEWYEDFPHIGYDLNGKQVMKPATKDELDALLQRMDDPKFMATFKDTDLHQDVTLTNDELEIIKKLQSGHVPHSDYDPYPEFPEPFVRDTMVEPLINPPEPKSRFIRSKWEQIRIMKIVKAIRKGLIIGKKPKPKQEERFYDIWKDNEGESEPHPLHIPAPKLKLPEHSESYNPPDEYLMTQDEIEKWKQTDKEDREHDYIPQKHTNLRSVPGYMPFMNERFARCLDLYLCPRAMRKRVVDPESLLPNLPDPKDLEPFPKYMAIKFVGHSSRVRCFSVDPTGQFMVSGSDDKTVRLWEVASGKCLVSWQFDDVVMSVGWNPVKSVSIFAVACGKSVYLINPEVSSPHVNTASDRLFKSSDPSTEEGTQSTTANSSKTVKWQHPTSEQYENEGYRSILQHSDEVTQVVWHKRGDYFATVAPSAGSQSVQVHQLSRHQSQNPFTKSKGLVQKVIFHPTKPHLLVATQTHIRIYNLVRQELHKKLVPGAKWISSIDVHPGGDNVIVGTYDKKTCWFDLDIGVHPYQIQRSHNQAVRNVTFHKKHPLFASCSDDGYVQVYHGMVYNDYMQNPLIVPVRKLKSHERCEGLGVLHCEFHPVKPWVFSSGADGLIKLFC